MARIDYSDAAAAAFQAARELPPDALSEWRAAISRHLAPRPGMRVLDLGAGTGTWATALASWYGINVVAVEPSPAMRARSRWPGTLAGNATALPLAPATMDGAWLSTVVHHLPDLPAAARELRRVLRPGAPVLIRGAFPGRHHGIGLFRYWPEAIAALDTFPSIAGVRTAFTAAGFSYVTLEPVRQVTAPSLAAIAATARREAHTPLRLISVEAYEAGLARLRAAATTQPGPSSIPSTYSSCGPAAPPRPHLRRPAQPPTKTQNDQIGRDTGGRAGARMAAPIGGSRSHLTATDSAPSGCASRS